MLFSINVTFFSLRIESFWIQEIHNFYVKFLNFKKNLKSSKIKLKLEILLLFFMI